MMLTHYFWATNKGPEMATSKETKKFAKCGEEIQIHTNGNDLTTRFVFSPNGLKHLRKI
jgi:hypothetical protein